MRLWVGLGCLMLVGCPQTIDPPSEPTQVEPTTGVTNVRVMTWNVETLGPAGSEELEATKAILRRLGPDIIGLNEVDDVDVDRLPQLAADLGYDHVLVATDNPYGSIRNAILSKFPPVEQTIWTSPMLSSDPAADDVTRYPLSMTVEIEQTRLTVVSQHWNAGFGDDEEFMRAVDAYRTGQVAEQATSEHVVVLGDVNAEFGDTEWPRQFVEVPNGVSRSPIGADIQAILTGPGLTNDPFHPFQGMTVLPLTQGDGREATRDESGRRIDYIFISQGLFANGWTGEVYDARDDGKSGLVLFGTPPDRESTRVASDHFPVIADLTL